jgi:hypothetical protein
VTRISVWYDLKDGLAGWCAGQEIASASDRQRASELGDSGTCRG